LDDEPRVGPTASTSTLTSTGCSARAASTSWCARPQTADQVRPAIGPRFSAPPA